MHIELILQFGSGEITGVSRSTRCNSDKRGKFWPVGEILKLRQGRILKVEEENGTASKVRWGEVQGGKGGEREADKMGVECREKMVKKGFADEGEIQKKESTRSARRLRRGFGESDEFEELQRCRAQKQKVSWKRERGLLDLFSFKRGLIFGEIVFQNVRMMIIYKNNRCQSIAMSLARFVWVALCWTSSPRYVVTRVVPEQDFELYNLLCVFVLDLVKHVRNPLALSQSLVSGPSGVEKQVNTDAVIGGMF